MWKSRASFDSERDQRWAHMKKVSKVMWLNTERVLSCSSNKGVSLRGHIEYPGTDS